MATSLPPFNSATDRAGNGVNVADIRDSYLKGDYATTNGLIARAGMSEAGAINAGANMGYTPADIAAMKSKGIVFAASGTPSENVGWNSNAIGVGSPVPAPAPTPPPNLDPNNVVSAGTTKIGAATPWNVTADQTVEGRIGRIVDPNSPLMQQAQTQANEASNQRGLINSSMAVTAGQDAMYRAATPIAEADAATYAKAAGYNADEQNQIAIKNADMANQIAQANLGANTSIYNANLGSKTQLGTAQISADTQLATAGMSAETQKTVAAMNADSQQKIASMDSATRVQLQQLQSQNQTLLNTSQQASQAFNQYVVAAANIQNNANLDAANKNAAMEALWKTTYAQLTVLSKVTSLDLTSLLDMSAFTPPTETPTSTPAPTSTPNQPDSGGASGGGGSGA